MLLQILLRFDKKIGSAIAPYLTQQIKSSQILLEGSIDIEKSTIFQSNLKIISDN